MSPRSSAKRSAEEPVELILRAPATLKVGVFRGPDGVTGAPVSITAGGFEADGLASFAGSTGPDGFAVFEDVPRATYDVIAEVPDGPKITHRQGVWADERELKLQVPDAITLKGKVTAGADGPPIAGAEITLQVRPVRGTGLFETVFHSAADGTYEVAVPKGRMQRFEAHAEGYAAWPNPANWRQRRSVSRSMRELGRGKAKVVTRDIVMSGGIGVKGTVTDEAGRPIPRLRLQLKPRRAGPVSVVTDDQGRYEAGQLNPDRYDIRIETPSWFPEERLFFEIPANQSEPIEYDIKLRGSRSFTGAVVSKTGQAIFGARVWVVGGGAPVWGAKAAGRTLETFTGADGRFRLADVPRDIVVSVRARHGSYEATPIAVPTGAPSSSLRLELAQTGGLEGVVYDALTRKHLADVEVRIVPVGEPIGRGGGTRKTDKQGRFRLTGLVPGTYHATPKRSGYLPADPMAIEVAGSERPTSRDLPLDPGLIFAGVVTDANGKPLAKARVDVSGEVDRRKVRNQRAYTDGQGRFRLTGYRPGIYTLAVRRGGYRRQVVQNLRGGEDRLTIALVRR